jgi:hypothetical protein
MAYKRLPKDLKKTLRKHGLKVVATPRWRRRGRPASTGAFAPVGVLCHHTATSAKSSVASVLRLLIDGRSDLPGPLCQIGLGRDGTVYLIASGRANHAGSAKASGTVAAGDGNTLYIGIEAFNDGVGEPWSKEQYEAYVLLCAVLSVEITGNSANTVRGHKETSQTGKVDPRFDMDDFRNRVAVKIGELTAKDNVVITRTRGARIDRALKDLRRAKGNGSRAKHIQAAIAELKLIKPAKTVSK